ncbi:MAG: hypothetical protein HUU33_14005 [Flavobacteriales bacterium]|nr:hypothetical protein [Flavobacteriales bacterium]
MDVKFASPTSPTTLSADVDDALTGSQAIEELIAHSFLVPVTGRREYALVNARTKDVILPGTSLHDAGVRDGDVIEVVQAVEGAQS